MSETLLKKPFIHIHLWQGKSGKCVGGDHSKRSAGKKFLANYFKLHASW